ncbi:ANTAR domain-containing protein [Streptomyces sp. NPDC046925]|uniref:ANTAR domain-containing protein n=1 Tax=Streptomyces sp. NPDC046925 TaxID=3155375 RepID=UPI0033EAB4FC
MSREEQVARAFVELADTLADDFDVIDYVERLNSRCREILDITDAVVLLASPEAPASPETRLYIPAAPTSGALGIHDTEPAETAETDKTAETAKAALLDAALREGPAVDGYRTAAAIAPGYLGAAPALWRDFTFRARAAGYTYAGAVPLRLRTETLGSLLLLRTGHGPMPAADLALAQALADAAAIGLLHARTLRQAYTLNEQLRTALHTRIVIEQAKGFLAARRGISLAEAFDTLRRRARHHRVRLAVVAQDVLADRGLPSAPPAARDPGRDTPSP